MNIQSTPFVKELAANDRPTRDAAVASLRTYLSGRHELSALELLKLWKGLFYTVWMSDRPRTQQALCGELAALVEVVHADTRIPFLRAFWLTMAREWTNIDVLRMEKFLLLVRRYLAASFAVCWGAQKPSSKSDAGLAHEMADLLKEVPCHVRDLKVPNGLRYHVIDVYVDELERVGLLDQEGDGNNDPSPVLHELLQPLRELARDSPTKTVRIKAKEALADDRITGNTNAEHSSDAVKAPSASVLGNKISSKSDGADDDDSWDGFDE